MKPLAVDGRAIRRYRLASDMTQAELCIKAGLAQSHLSRLERGESGNVEIATLGRISEALAVPLQYLLTDRAQYCGDESPLDDLPEDVQIAMWELNEMTPEQRADVIHLFRIYTRKFRNSDK